MSHFLLSVRQECMRTPRYQVRDGASMIYLYGRTPVDCVTSLYASTERSQEDDRLITYFCASMVRKYSERGLF